MQEGGGNEFGSLENFEIAFGVVMALGAVDDDIAGGVPCDFLQRGMDVAADIQRVACGRRDC